jgi:hypothetical protein
MAHSPALLATQSEAAQLTAPLTPQIHWQRTDVAPPWILRWEDRRAQREGTLAVPKSKVELFAAIRRDSRTEACRSAL